VEQDLQKTSASERRWRLAFYALLPVLGVWVWWLFKQTSLLNGYVC
jgi:hypothetical protein